MAHYTVGKGRPDQGWATRWEERLPLGMSLFVIAGCSALCWALVISIGMALLRFGLRV